MMEDTARKFLCHPVTCQSLRSPHTTNYLLRSTSQRPANREWRLRLESAKARQTADPQRGRMDGRSRGGSAIMEIPD